MLCNPGSIWEHFLRSLHYNQHPKEFTPVLGTLPRKSPAKYLKQTHFQTFLSPRHFCRHCQGSKSKHGEENKQNIPQPSPALLPCAKPRQWDDHSQAGSWIGLGFLKKGFSSSQSHLPPWHCREEHYQLSIFRRKRRAR